MEPMPDVDGRESAFYRRAAYIETSGEPRLPLWIALRTIGRMNGMAGGTPHERTPGRAGPARARRA